MEQLEKVNYDSDIIICDNDIPETISISSTPDKRKKPKTKKRKRKVKRGINFNNNMETLLITQKTKLKKLKKTKFKCIINLNTICEETGDSIVRFSKNVCKREAYFQRIVPMCLRRMCSGDSDSCCRSTISRDYKYLNPRDGSLSPVSSISLTEIITNNISYEDVSNGNFSTASEEELDTLIKRTRQREKHIDDLYTARDITSTPMSKIDDIPSPFSIEDKKSIHSDNTMILNALSSEAYSPTIDIHDTDMKDNLENTNGTSNGVIDMDISYSPTPDIVKVENFSSPSRTNDIIEDDTPYSPTYTPRSIEIEYVDCDRKSNLDMDAPYSPTFTPDFTTGNLNHTMLGIANIQYAGNEPYSPTTTPDMIKMEQINNYVEGTNAYVGYSPSSPTKTPDFKFEYNQIDKSYHHNVSYSPTVASNVNKYENSGDETYDTSRSTIVNTDNIKRENERSPDLNRAPEYDGTDYNVNDTVYCKTEWIDDQDVDGSEKDVKNESSDHGNVNHVHCTTFNDNFTVKTENRYGVKAEIQ